MTITFTPSANVSDSYLVYEGDTLIGAVRKVSNWTVRGSNVQWEATRKGRVVGREPTRGRAALLLNFKRG